MIKPFPSFLGYSLRTSLTLALCFALLTGCDQPQEAAQPQAKKTELMPPFDVFAIRNVMGKPFKGRFKCKTVPEPMYDLFFESMYDKGSKNSSVIDPEAHGAYKDRTKSIKELESGLSLTANRYVLSKPPKSEIAECVVKWLNGWAKENALLGKSNHMGDFVRKWALASIALSYIQVRDDIRVSDEDRSKIEKWIRELSERVVDDFSQRTDKKSRNNNHMYWAAWGVTAASFALDDRTLFNWGVSHAKQGIDQIAKDGSLPLEVERGQMAYNYHHYAAIPLFMIADAAAKNGIDLFSENDEGLRRLAKLLIANMEDQSYFEKIAGEKQNIDRTITRSNLTWMEAYYERYRDPHALKWLAGFRPVKHSRVGGDATMLYGLDKATELPQDGMESE